MRHYRLVAMFCLILLLTVVMTVLVWQVNNEGVSTVGNDVPILLINEVLLENPIEPPIEKTFAHEEGIMFVGDIMLGRHVERLNKQFGTGYSFLNTTFLSDRPQHLVGNFEAAIPLTHIPTPNFQFRFSVHPNILPSLKMAGFSHVSLANNHTYDFGGKGFDNTKLELGEQNISSFGHPVDLSTSSVVFLPVKDITIAIVAIHTLFQTPASEKISAVLSYASSISDYQIAYLHWGDEYQLVHNRAQKELAQELITAGVDLIIGHHPHVVQDIQKIDDKVVIYSLGNFIFDQYFSADVQQGLAVYVYPENGRLYAALIPHTSINTRAQPRQMNPVETVIFLESLAARSLNSLTSEILAQKLLLATSSKMAIMEQ